MTRAQSDNGFSTPLAHPIITEDVEIRGNLNFSGRLEFNGRLEGDLSSNGELIMGENAFIKGTVEAETADVAGKIQGDVITEGRVRIRPEAMIYGTVMGGSVAIDEGAVIEGTVMTHKPDRPAPDFSYIFDRLSRREDSAATESTPPKDGANWKSRRRARREAERQALPPDSPISGTESTSPGTT